MGASVPIFKGTIMANSKSIGVAFEDQNIIGADTVLVNGVLGYTTFAEGSVTQATSKSTGVTLNTSAGTITLNNASLASATNVSFTLTNSYISSNDTVILTQASGAASSGSYNVWVSALGTGTATITVRNITGGSLSEALVLNFALIHCQ
jgi:hypothetical protein